jgi:hypothetical protein
LFNIDQQGTTKRRALGNAKYRPLEGVRVIDLTNVVAGPTAGFALAEQGADVIAVHPPRGDWVTPIWLSVNWGKKTILTDIKSPDGKKRFVDLLAGLAATGLVRLTVLVSARPSCATSIPISFTGPSRSLPSVRRGPGAGDLSRLRRRSAAPRTCTPRVWG